MIKLKCNSITDVIFSLHAFIFSPCLLDWNLMRDTPVIGGEQCMESTLNRSRNLNLESSSSVN